MAIDLNQIMKLLQDPTVRQLVSSLMGKMGGGPPGNQLNGLLDQLSQKGLGDQVQSWVGQGDNAQMTPQQLTEALGPQQLDQMAKQAGVAPETAAQDLSQVLPQLVNAATPNGKMPDASDMDALLQQLAGAGAKPA